MSSSRTAAPARFLPVAWAALCLLHGNCHATAAEPRILRYRGMCDASAAVALGAEMFIAADDENNTLCVYRRGQGAAPVQRIAWDRHLRIDPREDKHPEADIEGATMLGRRIYWITSHGRNRNGKWRPNRHRFFAMTVTPSSQGMVAEPFGEAYDKLAEDLAEDDRMRRVGLAKALGKGTKESGELAPKKRGLNIEGLTAAADGRSLLIAFRNPLCNGKALLVRLGNPDEVLQHGAAPQFGDPIQLRLAVKLGIRIVDLGIRSIEYSPHHRTYLMVAGPVDQQKVFALYRWSGALADPPEMLTGTTRTVYAAGDLAPEALIVYPGKDEIQLLSDDGTLKVKVRSPAECEQGEYKDGQCEAKYLKDPSRKTFRSVWVGVD